MGVRFLNERGADCGWARVRMQLFPRGGSGQLFAFSELLPHLHRGHNNIPCLKPSWGWDGRTRLCPAHTRCLPRTLGMAALFPTNPVPVCVLPSSSQALPGSTPRIPSQEPAPLACTRSAGVTGQIPLWVATPKLAAWMLRFGS